jgi:hypothetical protein
MGSATETDNSVKVNGETKKGPFLIGVSGGTASGKVKFVFKIYIAIVLIFFLFFFSRQFVQK